MVASSVFSNVIKRYKLKVKKKAILIKGLKTSLKDMVESYTTTSKLAKTRLEALNKVRIENAHLYAIIETYDRVTIKREWNAITEHVYAHQRMIYYNIIQVGEQTKLIVEYRL